MAHCQQCGGEIGLGRVLCDRCADRLSTPVEPLRRAGREQRPPGHLSPGPGAQRRGRSALFLLAAAAGVVVVGFVALALTAGRDDGRALEKQRREMLSQLRAGVREFRTDMGCYPTSLSDLFVRPGGPYRGKGIVGTDRDVEEVLVQDASDLWRGPYLKWTALPPVPGGGSWCLFTDLPRQRADVTIVPPPGPPGPSPPPPPSKALEKPRSKAQKQWRRHEEARRKLRAQLQTAVEEFEADIGAWPTSLNDLITRPGTRYAGVGLAGTSIATVAISDADRLWKGPYVKWKEIPPVPGGGEWRLGTQTPVGLGLVRAKPPEGINPDEEIIPSACAGQPFEW